MSIKIKNIQEIAQEKAQLGIVERIALKPEETLSKSAKLTHLVIEVGRSFESKARDQETIYFVLSGHAIVTVNMPNGSWDRELSADSAAWIPSGFTHNIKNNGEGPLRVLQAMCKV